MQTLLDILKRAGGWNPGLYLKIENAPYMALVIEATDESGPSGLPAISVAHYGEQNGDLMRDPEDVASELGFAEGLLTWSRSTFRNDYLRNRAVEPHHRAAATTFTFPTCTSITNDSPSSGTTTCACQGFAEAFERQQTPRA